MKQPDELSGWGRVTPEQWQEMRPYVLDCDDLSEDQCREVRARFYEAGVKSARNLAEALGRPPTQEEFDNIRRALADHFNAAVIPAMVALG